MLSILSNRNQMKPCKHITAGTIHIFDWHTQASQPNFEPCILTKQTINTRRMNEVYQIDITNYDEDFKVNEAHIQNPNYKGKNYDPNYQNKNRNNGNNNNSSNSSSHSTTGYNKNYNNGMSNTKYTPQDKPTNVQVTLTGPVNREQLFKIQEVLRHPSQYRDKIPPNEWPATDEYAKSFNKFCPKKLEVNKATIDEVVGFSRFMRKSDAEVAEAIDIYKALGDDISYGSEDQQADPPQQD